MLLINKNLGETPLELLERIRHEQPELATEKLSYAGRLDPMAEGQMIVLVGEENAPENRAKFLGLDKEYIATFLVGIKTDTGDCLGLVEKIAEEMKPGIPQKESIAEQVENLKQIAEQTYPWFSGKAVNGVKLFDHFKAGKTDADIERPNQKIEIKEVELLDVAESEDLAEIQKYIFDAVGKVSGNFRQREILERWSEVFADFNSDGILPTFQTFQIRIVVSSGTFIRGLTENFDFPVTLLKLKRTKVFDL